MRLMLLAVTGFLMMPGFCMADSTATQNWKLKQSGFLALENGAIVHGIQDDNHNIHGREITKAWQERLLFNYGNELSLSERLRLYMTVECQMSFSYPYDQFAVWEGHQPQFSFYPERAEAQYSFGDLDAPYLKLGFGYFPFKTNPDAKDLGDYLFRTGTYPVYVINTFNRPYARLLGVRAGSTLFNDLHQDILLTSSNLLPPLVDVSLSYLVNYTVCKVFEAGAGISFCHLVTVDDKITTPQSPDFNYKDKNDSTKYYTFAGTKPMVRFAIDPKPLIPWDGFGKDDLRLYGEVCVTGWQNYNNYDIKVDTAAGGIGNFYANRADRTLYMLGFNMPTCKVFDVVSGELEWYPNRYPNSGLYMFGRSDQSIPVPSLLPSGGSGKVYPLFWSIYMKKTIVDKFSIIVQFARDHMRPINNNYQFQYTEDVLERKGDWWWAFRLNVKY
jgi:hypothetical protein